MHKALGNCHCFVKSRAPSRLPSRRPALHIACRAASTSNPAYSSPLSEQRARQAWSLFLLVARRAPFTDPVLDITLRRIPDAVLRLPPDANRDREDNARRAALQEIVSELSKTITRNGQRGVQRTFQALQAAISISTEYVTNFQQGIQEPPQVSLMPRMLIIQLVSPLTLSKECYCVRVIS